MSHQELCTGLETSLPFSIHPFQTKRWEQMRTELGEGDRQQRRRTAANVRIQTGVGLAVGMGWAG